MVQAYLGIKPADRADARKTEADNTEKDLDEFMRQFARMGGSVMG
jgi:hypothetical protein